MVNDIAVSKNLQALFCADVVSEELSTRRREKYHVVVETLNVTIPIGFLGPIQLPLPNETKI